MQEVHLVQGQTHYENGTLYFCHSSCDLLNAGTVESYLKIVADWVADHPYDVVTILFGNADYAMRDSKGNQLVTADTFVKPIEDSGLKQYIYTPPTLPMPLDSWPTLGEMIASGKRVVTFIDYNPRIQTVPYLLDE